MAFTVREFHDMVEILEAEPAWRQELRRLLLTEDILTLPQYFRELAESNRKFEDKVDKRFEQVDKRFEQVDKRFEQVDKRFEQVDKRLAHVESDIVVLKSDVAQLKTDVGKLTGRDLERMVRERPFVYLSRFARRLQIVDESKLAAMLEDAEEKGILTNIEMEDAKLIDSVAEGKRRSDNIPVMLVCEISSVIDKYDIERALRRAISIEKAADKEVLPVVLGETIADRMRQLADEQKVGWVVMRSQN